jgi:uncharacterized protein (TIGR03118 family)
MTSHRTHVKGFCALFCLLGLFGANGCGDDDEDTTVPPPTVSGYESTILVANKSDYDPENVDDNLVNAWGIAFNPDAFVWVANNGTGTATLYDGNGEAQPLVVTIPGGGGEEGGPTGIVFNSTDDFQITGMEAMGGMGGMGGMGPGPTGGTAGLGGIGGLGGSQILQGGPAKAVFLFAGLNGTISGWSPDVEPTKAVVAYDGSADDSAYTGLAIGESDGENFLYAANFAQGTIDVFDKDFKKQTSFSFEDPEPPQEEFSPFNVAVLDDEIWVAYAKKEGDEPEEEPGAGLGYINIFEMDGTFVRHFANGDVLNAPWAMVEAPDDFGELSELYLIGNFGDGSINAFDDDGNFVDTLNDADGDPIQFQGLWGLAFGNDQHDQPHNTLFFAAGPNDEADGIYGRIDVNEDE